VPHALNKHTQAYLKDVERRIGNGSDQTHSCNGGDGTARRRGGAQSAAARTESQNSHAKSDKAVALVGTKAEVVKGDLSDLASLQAAVRGVEGVFAMSTPFEAGMEAEVQQGTMLANAAKQAGVEHYVYTSVAGADRNTGVPHFETKWKVEQYLRRIGIPVTVLRPAAFMENFGTYFKPSAEGVLSLPVRPETKLQMIALHDIGEFGAAASFAPRTFSGRRSSSRAMNSQCWRSRPYSHARRAIPSGFSGFQMIRYKQPWGMT